MNLCNKGNLLCKNLYLMIQSMKKRNMCFTNGIKKLLCLSNARRNQIWIIVIELYHLHKIKIAKVVVNPIQIDTHNMKQNIDIMRS